MLQNEDSYTNSLANIIRWVAKGYNYEYKLPDLLFQLEWHIIHCIPSQASELISI